MFHPLAVGDYLDLKLPVKRQYIAYKRPMFGQEGSGSATQKQMSSVSDWVVICFHDGRVSSTACKTSQPSVNLPQKYRTYRCFLALGSRCSSSRYCSVTEGQATLDDDSCCDCRGIGIHAKAASESPSSLLPSLGCLGPYRRGVLSPVWHADKCSGSLDAWQFR